MIYSRSLIEPTPMCRQLEGAGRGESRPPPVQQRPPEIYPDRLVALNSP